MALLPPLHTPAYLTRRNVSIYKFVNIHHCIVVILGRFIISLYCCCLDEVRVIEDLVLVEFAFPCSLEGTEIDS